MQNRGAIYQDLLDYEISQKELNDFINGLTIRDPNGMPTTNPVTPLTEIDTYFRHVQSNCFYDSALCYAVHINNIKIVDALLRVGVHPNKRRNGTLLNVPALFLALCPKHQNLRF